MRPLTIGLLSVYFGLFDEAMPPSFRRDRLAYADGMAARLGEHGDVVFPGLVDSEAAGFQVGAALASAAVDVVVCAPSMAAPPSYGWSALEALPDVPVVVVVGQEASSIPDDYDTEQATQRSLPVGAVMLTNVLVRRNRPFVTMVGSIDDDDLWARLSATLSGIAAARAITERPMLAIGAPISGYWDVEATPDELGGLGVTVDAIDASTLVQAFEAVGDVAISEERSALVRRFDTDAVEGEVLERSVRLAVAVRTLVEDRDASGGAVNCHGDLLRFNDDVGITACLAVTQLTSAGLPFACTGDIPTGIALTLGRAVADWALYCELYQLDLAEDWVLVANGGEGDPGAAGGPPCLLPEDHYLGNHGPGVAISFPIATGPATLTSLSPVDGARGDWALVVAEGEIIDARHERMEGPNGMFRFTSGPVDQAYARWCEAGATHHAALLHGSRRDALAAAAGALGIEIRVV